MPSPFFLVRFVFLGVLSYFNLVILVVSSWHVKSSSFAELPVPAAAVFLLVLSIFSILFAVGALLPLFYPTTGTSQVRFECTWLFFMTMFELVSSIALSGGGTVEVCRTSSSWSVCASASILLPASWICSTMHLTYFLTLLIAGFMHVKAYPSVWDVSFYNVPWFSTVTRECATSPRFPHKSLELPTKIHGKPLGQLRPRPKDGKALPKVPRPHAIIVAYRDDDAVDEPSRLSQEAKLIDIEAGSPISEIERAPWAENSHKRAKRGVDTPFAFLPRPSTGHVWNTSSPPSLPPQIALPDALMNSSSRLIEHVRESHIISRNGGKMDHCMTSPDMNVFPDTVSDYDKPIPLPTMSSWIRANVNRNALRTASSTK